MGEALACGPHRGQGHCQAQQEGERHITHNPSFPTTPHSPSVDIEPPHRWHARQACASPAACGAKFEGVPVHKWVEGAAPRGATATPTAAGADSAPTTSAHSHPVSTSMVARMPADARDGDSASAVEALKKQYEVHVATAELKERAERVLSLSRQQPQPAFSWQNRPLSAADKQMHQNSFGLIRPTATANDSPSLTTLTSFPYRIICLSESAARLLGGCFIGYSLFDFVVPNSPWAPTLASHPTLLKLNDEHVNGKPEVKVRCCQSASKDCQLPYRTIWCTIEVGAVKGPLQSLSPIPAHQASPPTPAHQPDMETVNYTVKLVPVPSGQTEPA